MDKTASGDIVPEAAGTLEIGAQPIKAEARRQAFREAADLLDDWAVEFGWDGATDKAATLRAKAQER